jgi:glyoxalase family protein
LTPITNPRRSDGTLKSAPAAAGDKAKGGKEKVAG